MTVVVVVVAGTVVVVVAGTVVVVVAGTVVVVVAGTVVVVVLGGVGAPAGRATVIPSAVASHRPPGAPVAAVTGPV